MAPLRDEVVDVAEDALADEVIEVAVDGVGFSELAAVPGVGGGMLSSSGDRAAREAGSTIVKNRVDFTDITRSEQAEPGDETTGANQVGGRV